jgi:hypothetical protein
MRGWLRECRSKIDMRARSGRTQSELDRSVSDEQPGVLDQVMNVDYEARHFTVPWPRHAVIDVSRPATKLL